jgi:hypothetical protein
MGHVTVHKMSLEGQGQLKINANCTEAIAADQISIRGNFNLTDYVPGGWGGTISDDARFTVSNVWDDPTPKRLLGLLHENITIDNPVYDANSNLTGARVRIYSVAGSVGTDNDVLATYAISAPSSAPGKFITWNQVKS